MRRVGDQWSLGSFTIRLEASKEEENKDGKEQKEQKAIDFLVDARVVARVVERP